MHGPNGNPSIIAQFIKFMKENVFEPGIDIMKALGRKWQRLPLWVKIVLACLLAAGSAHLIIAAIGFGAPGVVAGSLAAGIHSSIGAVAAGSSFAILQSLGAAPTAIYLSGMGAGAVGAIGAVTLA